MDWQPLFVREGKALPDGPFEGVPEHLREALKEWLMSTAFDIREGHSARAHLLTQVAAIARVQVRREKNGRFGHTAVDDLAWTEETLLTAVDAVLQVAPTHIEGYFYELYVEQISTLRNSLVMGGSVWTVAKDGRSLVRRVDPEATDAYEVASTPADTVSEELETAWRTCFGRNPDPSDAWDHAVKAVEAALIPIVTPKQRQPQFGHLVGNLTNRPEDFDLVLTPIQRGQDRLTTEERPAVAVETLQRMLRLMWPNPDRHPGEDRRQPTQHEAEAVVHLAVTIVQWSRGGVISSKK